MLRYLPPVASDQGPVGLAEFTAALSLAADDLRQVYYTALLRSVGCTSDAHEQAELFGDEIAARTRLNLAPHLPTRELLGVLARHSGAGERPVRRAAALGRTLAASRELPRRVAAAHYEKAQRLSVRLGLPDSVSGALHAVFVTGTACPFSARWPGHLKIVPGQAVMLASNAVTAEPVR